MGDVWLPCRRQVNVFIVSENFVFKLIWNSLSVPAHKTGVYHPIGFCSHLFLDTKVSLAIVRVPNPLPSFEKQTKQGTSLPQPFPFHQSRFLQSMNWFSVSRLWEDRSSTACLPSCLLLDSVLHWSWLIIVINTRLEILLQEHLHNSQFEMAAFHVWNWWWCLIPHGYISVR